MHGTGEAHVWKSFDVVVVHSWSMLSTSKMHDFSY